MRCLRDTWSDGTACRTCKTSKASERLHRQCQEVVDPRSSGFGEDTVSRLPDDLHFAEGRIPEALVRGAEWVISHDALGLPQRPPRRERPVHLEMRAVDGIAECVEERDVSLECRDRAGPLVAVCKGERDVVLVALLLRILRQEGLVHDADDEHRVELPLD